MWLALVALALTVSVLLGAALSTPSGAAAREPVFVKGYGGFKHRPERLALWASDGFVNLRWSGWGGRVASAVGEVTEHSQGIYRTVPARVELSGVARCDRRLVYLAVRYRVWDGPWQRGHASGCQISG